MYREHATTIEALINWLRREDDIGKINDENYKALACLADRWDIPMLLHDIDVFSRVPYTDSGAVPLR
jgi:hypothetical protein